MGQPPAAWARMDSERELAVHEIGIGRCFKALPSSNRWAMPRATDPPTSTVVFSRRHVGLNQVPTREWGHIVGHQKAAKPGFLRRIFKGESPAKKPREIYRKKCPRRPKTRLHSAILLDGGVPSPPSNVDHREA